MATKKASPAQIAARKLFTERAKNGTLKKAKTTTAKKKPALKKPAPGMTKFAAKNVHVEGVKRDGTLKKGYKYIAGGKIVKIKPAAKKTTARKKAVSKPRKKFLGIF